MGKGLSLVLADFIKKVFRKELVSVRYEDGERFQIDDDEFGIVIDGIIEGSKGIYFSGSIIGNLPFSSLYDTTFIARKKSEVLVINSKSFIPELLEKPFFFTMYINLINKLGIFNSYELMPLLGKKILGVVGDKKQIEDIIRDTKLAKRKILLILHNDEKLEDGGLPFDKIENSEIGISILDGKYLHSGVFFLELLRNYDTIFLAYSPDKYKQDYICNKILFLDSIDRSLSSDCEREIWVNSSEDFVKEIKGERKGLLVGDISFSAMERINKVNIEKYSTIFAAGIGVLAIAMKIFGIEFDILKKLRYKDILDFSFPDDGIIKGKKLYKLLEKIFSSKSIQKEYKGIRIFAPLYSLEKKEVAIELVVFGGKLDIKKLYSALVFPPFIKVSGNNFFPAFTDFHIPLEVFFKGEFSFDVLIGENELPSLSSVTYRYILERGLDWWHNLMDEAIPFGETIIKA